MDDGRHFEQAVAPLPPSEVTTVVLYSAFLIAAILIGAAMLWLAHNAPDEDDR